MENDRLAVYAIRGRLNVAIQDESNAKHDEYLLSVVEIKKSMETFSHLVRRYVNDQAGVTAVEYAIMGVGISAIILAVFITDTTFKDTLVSAFQIIATNIDSVNN